MLALAAVAAASLLAGLPRASAQAPRLTQSALLGTYEGWVVQGRGERPDRGQARITELTIDASRIRARDDQQSFGEGGYRFQSNDGPCFLDPTGTAGPTRGKSYLGICEMRGDALWWCTANPGHPRPTVFMSQPGSGQYLMVLKRVRR